MMRERERREGRTCAPAHRAIRGRGLREAPGAGSVPAGALLSAGGRVSRREFLQGALLGAAGVMGSPLWLPRDRAWAAGLPGGKDRAVKVIRTTHPGATTGWDQINQEPVNRMVHAAVRQLTGVPDTAEAWKSLFPGIDSSKRVALKINLACGDVPTHPEVINAIIDGLLSMDLDGETLPPEHIIVWDMDNAFFCPQTGYTQNWGGPGVQYVGTDHPSVGWDLTQAYTVQHSGSQTIHHPSKLLTQHCDYLINVPVIKDHDNWAGITMTMKNHYGSFDGIPVYETHYAGFNTGIPGINKVLRDDMGLPTSLYLMDATYGLYDGGPGYTPPGHTPPNWIYNSVFASFDPVAMDRIGTIKMNQKRISQGLGALDPGHITAAGGAPYYLGESNPDYIDLVEIDVSSAGAPEEAAPAAVSGLLVPYPNPARDRCTLRFRLARAGRARVRVVDARGALVRSWEMQGLPAGTHRIDWDGRVAGGDRVPNGVYFCHLTAEGESRVQRLVWVR